MSILTSRTFVAEESDIMSFLSTKRLGPNTSIDIWSLSRRRKERQLSLKTVIWRDFPSLRKWKETDLVTEWKSHEFITEHVPFGYFVHHLLPNRSQSEKIDLFHQMKSLRIIHFLYSSRPTKGSFTWCWRCLCKAISILWRGGCWRIFGISFSGWNYIISIFRKNHLQMQRELLDYCRPEKRLLDLLAF